MPTKGVSQRGRRSGLDGPALVHERIGYSFTGRQREAGGDSPGKSKGEAIWANSPYINADGAIPTI